MTALIHCCCESLSGCCGLFAVLWALGEVLPGLTKGKDIISAPKLGKYEEKQSG